MQKLALQVPLSVCKMYAICGPETTTETMEEIGAMGMEVKTFDIESFKRAKEVLPGRYSVILSVRDKMTWARMTNMRNVASTRVPVIVNSLQKVNMLRNYGVRIGVFITPVLMSPGISQFDELNQTIKESNLEIGTLSYPLCSSKNIEELKELLHQIKTHDELHKARIFDLGEWNFDSDEEAKPFMEILKKFQDEAFEYGFAFEYRFGFAA